MGLKDFGRLQPHARAFVAFSPSRSQAIRLSQFRTNSDGGCGEAPFANCKVLSTSTSSSTVPTRMRCKAARSLVKMESICCCFRVALLHLGSWFSRALRAGSIARSSSIQPRRLSRSSRKTLSPSDDRGACSLNARTYASRASKNASIKASGLPPSTEEQTGIVGSPTSLAAARYFSKARTAFRRSNSVAAASRAESSVACACTNANAPANTSAASNFTGRPQPSQEYGPFAFTFQALRLGDVPALTSVWLPEPETRRGWPSAIGTLPT